jgi:hypothetical protein
VEGGLKIDSGPFLFGLLHYRNLAA